MKAVWLTTLCVAWVTCGCNPRSPAGDRPADSTATAANISTSADSPSTRPAQLWLHRGAPRELPSGARVGGEVFDKSSKIEVFAKRLQGCGSVQMNLGANVITCHGGRVLLIAAGSTGVEAGGTKPARSRGMRVHLQAPRDGYDAAG
jgi:hypothetical protein